MSVAKAFDRHGGGERMLSVAADYERRFSTRFDSFVYFDADLLAGLHAPGPMPDVVPASAGDRQVIDAMATITTVANLADQTDDDRLRYLSALEEIFGRLADPPATVAARADLVVAPQREGRILAERIGCLPDGGGRWTPQAKRMTVDGGLLVGFDHRPARRVDGRLAIVDGVVASGVTLMAALQLVTVPGATVDLFTCHATAAGAQALRRYAQRLDIRLTLRVGHISGRLNGHFYAVDPDHDDRLVLGDIGDTISPVVAGSGLPR
nr:hypothetical protein [Micromonospora sp. DSM 115978]